MYGLLMHLIIYLVFFLVWHEPMIYHTRAHKTLHHKYSSKWKYKTMYMLFSEISMSDSLHVVKQLHDEFH
jgi:hypothetical protein